MKIFLVLILSFLTSCKRQSNSADIKTNKAEIRVLKTQTVADDKPIIATPKANFESNAKTIHIIVALCDNRYQGIIPVPSSLGNGQDPKNNLYWGAAYGIKAYFKRSSEWRLINRTKSDSLILERVVFKHTEENYYVVADAYDGKFIRNATETFLKSSAGILKDTLRANDQTLGIMGNAELVAYIGHNGLMDFSIEEEFTNSDSRKRDVIILACYSQDYFKSQLTKSNVNPLAWTTGLMAPEAYTIHDAITGYIKGETNEQIRLRAAKAYHKYQKCGLGAAKNLLVTN